MRAHGHGVRHWRRAMPAAAAALSIWAGLGGTALLLADQRPAASQSAEAVGRIAQAITVRIEGATQGSGVLVRREGNRYTVLTAWHVVADQKPGEELAVFTPDEKQHQVELSSIAKIKDVDLATLTFTSTLPYRVASLADPKLMPVGSSIYIGGFPVATSAIPARIFRGYDANLSADPKSPALGVHALIYTTPTMPGMSGGPILDATGKLIGLHVRSETEVQQTSDPGVVIRTGTSQGIPVSYYQPKTRSGFESEARELAASQVAGPLSADGYLARAKALHRTNGSKEEIVRLASEALETRRSAEAYFLRGSAKLELGDERGAIEDLNQAIAINPEYAEALGKRGQAKSRIGDRLGAIADFTKVIASNPKAAKIIALRGAERYNLNDKQGACSDFSKAASLGDKSAVKWLQSTAPYGCGSLTQPPASLQNGPGNTAESMCSFRRSLGYACQ